MSAIGSCTTFLIRDEDGAVSRICAVVVEITAQKGIGAIAQRGRASKLRKEMERLQTLSEYSNSFLRSNFNDDSADTDRQSALTPDRKVVRDPVANIFSYRESARDFAIH